MSTKTNCTGDRAHTLFTTTIVLTLTTLFARTIVVYYNVYLSGKIGAVGIGIFELIMSVYAFAKTAATAGVSLATTRLSAENENFSKTMRRILLICLLLGIFCALALILLAPFLCKNVLDDPPGGEAALKILAVSLPFLAMSSAFGGHFLARRKMKLYAPINICEQLIRVGLTVILLERFSRDTLAFSVASIALAITLSEVVAFLFSSFFYCLITKRTNIKPQVPTRFLHSFTRLALPVGAGALFRASLNTVYNILVPFGLRRSGASSERSLASYGIIQGMALPIILYPSALMGSLALQLVPEIASLHAQGKTGEITYIARRVLRIALLFSLTCAGVMFFFAEELSLAVFSQTDSAPFIRALAPLIPIMYLDTVSDGILKGLDLQLKVLGIGIVDSFLSLTLIYFLLPPFAMTGYIITIYAGECINTLLGQIELRRHLKLRLSFFNDLFLPMLCIALACQLTKRVFLYTVAPESVLGVTASILAAVCGGILLCILTHTVKKEELHWARKLFSFKYNPFDKNCGRRNSINATHNRTPSEKA